MKIIYLGTPEFAVPPLRLLLENGYEIVAVVTAPDKPGGRQGTQVSAVKKFALEHQIPVLQPERLKNADFLEQLRTFQADLQIVVAFRMLPEAVWKMPAMGTMNLHGSLLPKYRGAAPINWAIINGEKETGLSTFLLKHEIDTGDLLLQKTVPIDENETAGELHDRMMEVGAELVLASVQALENHSATPFPQSNTAATHAPKIFKETCQINFARPVTEVHNFVRGLSPFPGAWTELDGKIFKILRAEREFAIPGNEPGTFVSDGKNYLKVSTTDGFLNILDIQMEGKRRMQVREFLNGYRLGGA